MITLSAAWGVAYDDGEMLWETDSSSPHFHAPSGEVRKAAIDWPRVTHVVFEGGEARTVFRVRPLPPGVRVSLRSRMYVAQASQGDRLFSEQLAQQAAAAEARLVAKGYTGRRLAAAMERVRGKLLQAAEAAAPAPTTEREQAAGIRCFVLAVHEAAVDMETIAVHDETDGPHPALRWVLYWFADGGVRESAYFDDRAARAYGTHWATGTLAGTLDRTPTPEAA